MTAWPLDSPSSPPRLSLPPAKLATTTGAQQNRVIGKRKVPSGVETLCPGFVGERLNSSAGDALGGYEPSVVRWESPSQSCAHSLGQ